MRTDLFEWRPTRARPQDERWSDSALLDATLRAYQECVDSRYHLAHRPDRSNRSSKEVDAILESPGRESIAIEITALESFSGQFLEESRIRKVLLPLANDLRDRLPTGLWCIIPSRAYAAGFDWQAVSKRLVSFLLQIGPELIPGASAHDVAGVPFKINLKFDPRLRVPFQFALLAPSKEEINTDLLKSIEKALSHKKQRLFEYAARGFRTAVVLDSAEFQLTSWVEPYKAFLRAETSVGSDHARDIVFCMTSDHNRIYCTAFKGDAQFRKALNPPNLKFGPEYSSIWQE